MSLRSFCALNGDGDAGSDPEGANTLEELEYVKHRGGGGALFALSPLVESMVTC